MTKLIIALMMVYSMVLWYGSHYRKKWFIDPGLNPLFSYVITIKKYFGLTGVHLFTNRLIFCLVVYVFFLLIVSFFSSNSIKTVLGVIISGITIASLIDFYIRVNKM